MKRRTKLISLVLTFALVLGESACTMLQQGASYDQSLASEGTHVATLNPMTSVPAPTPTPTIAQTSNALMSVPTAVAQSMDKTMEDRNESQMMNWVLLADSLSILKIKAFFCGLKRDFEAVLNSVKHVENNAVLEGNVNRLKMIKRTMYGRAGYDLLRAKVLRGVVMI